MDIAVLLNCRNEFQSSGCLSLPLSVHNKPSVTIFKRSYSTSSVLWKDIHYLFGDIKKQFFLIKTLALEKKNCIQTEDPLTYVQDARTNISNVFKCILNNLQSLSLCSASEIKPHSKVITNLITEIKHLLIFIGRINQIPNIVNIADSVYSSDYHYCYVHLCLELWYNSIAVLLAVNSVPLSEEILESFCSDLDQLDTHLQVITLFVIDFLCIAVRINRNSNSLCSSPFICKCFEDFWGKLIKAFSTILAEGKYSFWTVYRNAIQNVQKQISCEKSITDLPIDAFPLIAESIECSQISEPCLWLTSYIAPLYTVGNNTEQITISGYPVVKFLVHSLLVNNAERAEKNLRCALFYTWKILSLWEPSSEVLLTLTDFFIKKIDETYSFNENGLKDLPYLFNDSISWFKYIDNLSNSCITLRNDTSFYIFLRILYKQLTMDSNEGSLWRSLKGRVYSKFVPKKLMELSDVGLQNSYSLILTVAASGQVEAVDKISNLVSIFKTCSTKKQLISWKALFVLMLIYQKKEYNLVKIVAKAVDFFNLKCSEYSSTKDSLNKINIINLLLVYINGMKELFKQCNCLKLSECKLVASGFSLLLPACGVSEMNNVLFILLEIFQKVQDIASDMDGLDNSIILTEYIEFLELSFKNIYPFLKKISQSDTAPIVVSDIAAVLTILSYKFTVSVTEETKDSFSSIFNYFVCENSVNQSVMCHYLYLVLKEENLLTALKKRVPDFTLLIFRSWLKLLIVPPTVPLSCDEVCELSFKVLSLGDFVEIFPKARDLDFRSNPCDIAVNVFKIMGETFNEISNLQQKHHLKVKAYSYFENFASHASSQVKKHPDRSTLVYNVISHIVEHCSLLLHMQYKCDNILQKLFDQVILVNKVFPGEKHQQSILSQAINEFLPRFLKGIFKLDYRKDPFALRVIKHLMINHIFIHPSKNNSIKKLMTATLCNRPKSLKWDECEFLLNNITEHVFTDYPDNPTYLIEMMYELFETAPPNKKDQITNHLLKSILHFYVKQTRLSHYLEGLICKICSHLKKIVDLSCSKTILIPILHWFIEEKIIKLSCIKSFDALGCIFEHLPEIVSDVVPFLTKAIEKQENLRGSGENVVLRDHLKKTVSRMQRKLNPHEMS